MNFNAVNHSNLYLLYQTFFMKLFNLRNCFLLSVLFFVSCSKKDKFQQAKLIPRNASYVVVFNTPSVIHKTDDPSFIKVDQFLEKLSSRIKDDKIKKEYEKLKTYFNTTDPYVFFTTVEEKSAATIVHLSISLKDAAGFEQYLQTNEETKKLTITKNKQCNSISLDESVCAAWNKDYLIIGISTGSLFNKFGANTKQANITDLTTKLFSLEEKATVLAIPQFTDLLNKPSDMYFFSNTSAYIPTLKQMPYQLPKLDNLLTDNFSATTINFENGKVVVDGKSFLNKPLNALLSKYAGPTVNMQALENYPGSTLNGFMLSSFKPEIISAILKELDVESLADGFLMRENLSTADIFKALKGDINVMLSDFSIDFTQPSLVKLNFIADLPVGDKTSYNKIMDVLSKTGMIKKAGNDWKLASQLPNTAMYFCANENHIVFASDSATYLQYTNQTNKKQLPAYIADIAKNKAMSMYLDLGSVVDGCKLITEKDSISNKVATKAKQTFKYGYSNMENLKDGVINSHSELVLANDKQNSLVQIHNFIAELIYEASGTPFLMNRNAVNPSATMPMPLTN